MKFTATYSFNVRRHLSVEIEADTPEDAERIAKATAMEHIDADLVTFQNSDNFSDTEPLQPWLFLDAQEDDGAVVICEEALPDPDAPAAADADLALVLAMAERFAAEGDIADGPNVIVEQHDDGSVTFKPQEWFSSAAIGDERTVTADKVAEARAWLRDAGCTLSDEQPTPADVAAAVERLRAHGLPKPGDRAPIAFALRNASGAISSLLHQIGQMSGMFNDEDGTIQDAVDAGEAAEIEIENALERLGLAEGVGAGRQPEPITVAVSVTGGVLQWGGADREGVRLIVIDYDQDGVERGTLVDMAEPTDTREEFASVYEEGVEINPEAIARIVEKRAERELRESRFEANKCVECGVDLDAPSAADAEDGVCGRCIEGDE